MIAEGVSYEEQLRNHQLATELLKRKLRTSYVSQLIKSISLSEIRDMHRTIHRGESPRSGLLPAIEAIPQVWESMLYLSLFASLYRHASQADIKTEMDVPAIMVAWDFFVALFLTTSVNAGLTEKSVLPISAKPGSLRKRLKLAWLTCIIAGAATATRWSFTTASFRQAARYVCWTASIKNTVSRTVI